ncbi:GNAT family N-acetyltransferase [Ekhidna sp.]|uniref:GNAT family N-acetyltransferase n=1 Tax=Ekhidna sp. TaxID=2608089 RepID=UPI003B5B0CB2
MIERLNNTDEDIATQIRYVFQLSYAIEAKLLNAENNFPPLKRPLTSYVEADSSFYGYYESSQLAAIIEVSNNDNITHIQSLVVHPDFFRRGIASQLIEFVLNSYNNPTFTVETGAANAPAIALYEGFGFRKVKQWMTKVGIEKVAFEKII